MSYDPFDHDYERGMRNRRSVLGDAWVDRSVAKANNFNADFQNMITRFAWNDIWGRPGLDHKTRRIIVLSITIALGRWEEYELHVRAALLGEDGSKLTPDELKEVLMQSAIYAGVPAANTAFSHAQKILEEVSASIGYLVAPAVPAQAAHPGTGQSYRSTHTPSLHYTIREPRNGKIPRHTIVVSHALGCDHSMWDSLANLLAQDNRVITYDHRGHGSSDAPHGLYAISDLADDAAALLREVDSGPVVWVGLSMGGMVGQELALRHPTLVSALVLANTTSGYPEAAQQAWQQRITTVKDQGIDVIADAVMGRYFHEQFRQTHATTVAQYRHRLVTTDIHGYMGCCHAVGTVNTTDRLHTITQRALVIAGDLDQGTPIAMAETLCTRMPNASLAILQQASHLSAIESPEAFAQLVTVFVADL
jgi:3-oxoadipate enol-lactonase